MTLVSASILAYLACAHRLGFVVHHVPAPDPDAEVAWVDYFIPSKATESAEEGVLIGAEGRCFRGKGGDGRYWWWLKVRRRPQPGDAYFCLRGVTSPKIFVGGTKISGAVRGDYACGCTLEPIEPAELTEHGYAFARFVRHPCREPYPGPRPAFALSCSEVLEPVVEPDVTP